jgi:ABC-type branched-subunit amino acid transport system permease subunit
MLEILAQAVINGLLIGGIYALVSIGVTLIFGVVKIVNFAQGEFVMIGMYISFFLATQFGRYRPHRLIGRVDAGSVRHRRPDPALPDPQGFGTQRFAPDIPDLCVVATYRQPFAYVVYGKLPHRSHLVL